MPQDREEKPYSEQFNQLWDIVLKASGCVGANIYQTDYEMNWITYLVIICISFAFSGTAYSIYVGVIVNKDWSMLLLASCYWGPGIQGSVKLQTFISNASSLRFLHSEINEMYATYERKSLPYQESLKSTMSLVKCLRWALLVLYGLAPLTMISVTIIYRFATHENIPIMHFLIPGVERDTRWGLLLHDVIHIVSMLVACFGNFGNDFVLFVYVVHIPLLKNILKCKFEDLNETLRKNPRDAAKSTPMLRDIFLWHQKLLNFVELTKNVYFAVIFVEIITSVNSIICTLVCHFLGVFPGAPIYLLYSYFLMYAYCALGNFVDVANDDIVTMIYDSLWYEMTVSEQKMLKIMLRSSQRSQGMTIGGISPLNLNTGVQLSKSIYTVAMLLNNFY